MRSSARIICPLLAFEITCDENVKYSLFITVMHGEESFTKFVNVSSEMTKDTIADLKLVFPVGCSTKLFKKTEECFSIDKRRLER